MVLDAMHKYGAADYKVIDIGGGYGLFAEEMESLSGQRVLVIEPNPHFASVCREKSFQVIDKFLEDIETTLKNEIKNYALGDQILYCVDRYSNNLFESWSEFYPWFFPKECIDK